MKTVCKPFALIGALALAACPAAQADLVTLVLGGVPSTASSGPIQGAFDAPIAFSGGSGSVSQRARADFGQLGVDVGLAVSSSLAAEAATFAQAGWAANYVFHAPTGSTVPVSMNVVLTGRIDMGGAGGELDLTMRTNGGAAGSTTALFNGASLVRANGWLVPEVSKVRFDGGLFTLVLTTPTVDFSVDEPHELFLDLVVSLHQFVQGATVSEHADFFDTLTFPVGGLAFNLPAGATVSGPMLIDNCFGGAAACSASAVVPEPASLALAVLGLLLVLRVRPRRANGPAR